MKRITSLFLICILLLPITGFYFSQHFSLKKLKREVKSQILQNWNKQEIVTISISNQDLKSKNIEFFPEDHEVDIEGKMYDIVEQIHTSEGLVLKCIADKKETIFKAKIKDQLIALYSQNSTKSKQAKSFFQFAQNLFFQENFSFNFLKTFEDKIKISYHFLSTLSHVDIRLNSPPPELF